MLVALVALAITVLGTSKDDPCQSFHCGVPVAFGYVSPHGMCNLTDAREPVCVCDHNFFGPHCEEYNINNQTETGMTDGNDLQTAMEAGVAWLIGIVVLGASVAAVLYALVRCRARTNVSRQSEAKAPLVAAAV